MNPCERVKLAPLPGVCDSTQCNQLVYARSTGEKLEESAAHNRGLLCDRGGCLRYHEVLSFDAGPSASSPIPAPTLFSELVKALKAQQDYDSAHGRCSRLGATEQQQLDLEEAARQLAVAEERFEKTLAQFIEQKVRS